MLSELLRAELRQRDPDLERVQHQRAARWFEREGAVDEAIDHACAGGEYDYAGELIARATARQLAIGHAATVRGWLEKVPTEEIGRNPSLAAAAAYGYIQDGDVERVRHWLAVLERTPNSDERLADGSASITSAVAIIRAWIADDGLHAMRRDASTAYVQERSDPEWRGRAAYLLGTAELHLGEVDAGVARLDEARDLAVLQTPQIQAVALAELAFAAADKGEWEKAAALAAQARVVVEQHGLERYATMAPVYAASALTCARRRQSAEARRDAAVAVRLAAALEGGAEWMRLEALIAVGSTYVTMGDAGLARKYSNEVRESIRNWPEAVTMRRRFEELWSLAYSDDLIILPEPLTAAEVRVLQFLPTHLTYREIAERLHVSRNTVKTQVISAYRKLGATNRTEAVDSAQRAGLIDSGGPAVIELPDLERKSG